MKEKFQYSIALPFFVLFEKEIMRLQTCLPDCDRKLSACLHTFTLNLLDKKRRRKKKNRQNQSLSVKITQNKLIKLALMRMLAELCQIKHLPFSAM
jgi:hypothetical protein